MNDKKQAEVFNVGDEFELVARDQLMNRWGEVASHNIEYFDHVARMSSALVEKWGMVAGKPDGEDSAGRAKLAMLEPSEIVERATSTAELLIAKLRSGGHILKAPGIKQILGFVDDDA